MRYRVIKRVPISNNTSVVIEGDGAGLKNDIMINGGDYHLISVGISGKYADKTVLLVEGTFMDDFVIYEEVTTC